MGSFVHRLLKYDGKKKIKPKKLFATEVVEMTYEANEKRDKIFFEFVRGLFLNFSIL